MPTTFFASLHQAIFSGASATRAELEDAQRIRFDNLWRRVHICARSLLNRKNEVIYVRRRFRYCIGKFRLLPTPVHRWVQDVLPRGYSISVAGLGSHSHWIMRMWR